MEGGWASNETSKEWFYSTRVGGGAGGVQVGRLFYTKALNHRWVHL